MLYFFGKINDIFLWPIDKISYVCTISIKFVILFTQSDNVCLFFLHYWWTYLIFSRCNWGISCVFSCDWQKDFMLFHMINIICGIFLLHINKFHIFYSWDRLANFLDLLAKLRFFHVNLNFYHEIFSAFDCHILRFSSPQGNGNFSTVDY